MPIVDDSNNNNNIDESSIVDEPSTYQEAGCIPEWQLAMSEELAALDCQGTSDLVPLPSHVVPITSKWVFKVKTKSDGSIERYKARLVARGFQQTQGLDYDETFAPVAHMTTICILLAVAAASSWSTSQMDVKNAFLHGDLTDEVYMQPPPRIVAPLEYVKAIVWFWIIDETLVLTSILSMCRLNEVGTYQVMEQAMIMVTMVMTIR